MSVVLGQVAYEPIKIWNMNAGLGFPTMSREPEAATQTNKLGTLVKLVAGYLTEVDFVGADIVYGVTSEPAHNLATSGTAKQLSEDTPPNQTSAVITPVGAWVRDGNLGVYHADGNNVFSISLKATQTFSQALITNPATLYGLTKDATSGFWYLDTADTAGNNAVAHLLGVDSSSPNTSAGGCRVFFQFASAARFFI